MIAMVTLNQPWSQQREEERCITNDHRRSGDSATPLAISIIGTFILGLRMVRHRKAKSQGPSHTHSARTEVPNQVSLTLRSVSLTPRQSCLAGPQ